MAKQVGYFMGKWPNKCITLWETDKTSWLFYGKVAKQVGYFMGKWQNKCVTLWARDKTRSLLCGKVAKQIGYFVGNLFAQNLTEHNRKTCEQTSAKIIGKVALEFSV